MRMTRSLTLSLAGCLASALMASDLKAALVVSWGVDQGTPVTANMNTGSPTIGDGTANNADATTIHGAFPDISLVNTGDSVTLTGSITLTGITASNQNLRFGLFDRFGSPDVNGWLGSFVSVSSGAGAGQIRQRITGNTALFMSNTGTTIIASTANPPHTGNGAVLADGTYSFSMQFARDGANYDITAAITGGPNNLSNTFFIDNQPPVATETFTFNNVGILLGDGLNTDQAQLTNVDVTYRAVPEPATLSLWGLSAALVCRRSRSARRR